MSWVEVVVVDVVVVDVVAVVECMEQNCTRKAV